MAGKPSDGAIRHGTRYSYTRKRCRCDLCRKANADYIRGYYHDTGRRRAAVTVAVYPKISATARLLLGNELEWDGQPPYGVRREYLESS